MSPYFPLYLLLIGGGGALLALVALRLCEWSQAPRENSACVTQLRKLK